jgi:hypothetical protein
VQWRSRRRAVWRFATRAHGQARTCILGGLPTHPQRVLVFAFWDKPVPSVRFKNGYKTLPHPQNRQFHSKLGRAYLFDDVVNVVAGPLEERLMTTGMHIVRSVRGRGRGACWPLREPPGAMR